MARYAIVPERSQLAAVARSGVHPIHGESSRLTGSIEVTVRDGDIDMSVPPTAHIELAVEDLSADNALYDGELKRLMEADRYPTVVGDVVQVDEPRPDGSHAVRGDLTLHGVTLPVEGTATARLRGQTLSVDGELMFNMKDFGLLPPKIMMLTVFPEIEVRIELVAEPVS